MQWQTNPSNLTSKQLHFIPPKGKIQPAGQRFDLTYPRKTVAKQLPLKNAWVITDLILWKRAIILKYPPFQVEKVGRLLRFYISAKQQKAFQHQHLKTNHVLKGAAVQNNHYND